MIGVGFVEGVDPVKEWEYSYEGERIGHVGARGGALDPSAIPTDFGCHQRAARPRSWPERTWSRSSLEARWDHFDEFSYVSELVSHDGAIAALPNSRALSIYPGVVDGPGQRWHGSEIGSLLRGMRGPYPGMGPMLAAAGLDRGPLLARRSTAFQTGASTRGLSLEKAIGENRDGLVGRLARKAWERLIADDARYRRCGSCPASGHSRAGARIVRQPRASEVLDNPYRLFEIGCSGELAFSTIDRGLWPQDADAKAALEQDPIDEPVTEPPTIGAWAACIHVLERAAEQGHTILDEAGCGGGSPTSSSRHGAIRWTRRSR